MTFQRYVAARTLLAYGLYTAVIFAIWVTAIWVLATMPAHAQDVAPATTISALPWYQLAEPYLVTIVGTIAGILATIVLGYLATLLHVNISSTQMNDARNVVQTAASNAAGRILAAQEGNIAAVKFDIHSPEIAAEVPILLNAVKDEANKVGITPENSANRIGNLILGKIGQQQAIATMPVAAPPIPPDAPVQATPSGSTVGTHVGV